MLSPMTRIDCRKRSFWLVVMGVMAIASPWVAASAEPIAGAPDPIRTLQRQAEEKGVASWGHWGDSPDRYVSWSNHSNRLIPVYTFGTELSAYAGATSVYRNEARLQQLYGYLPNHTVNPTADYFDQTDLARLQLAAADAGKKYVILVIFDGLDWTMTRAASIATTGRVAYHEGRGTGFAFQDYRGCPTDFGFVVTSPANDGTTFDVDAQAIRNPGGKQQGGFDVARGGMTPWAPRPNLTYLIGRDRDRPHAFTDSAASATALCTGHKTYNDAINVGPQGERFDPVARVLQQRGYAVGAVTSVPVPHATPACSYANNVSRDDYQDISRDMLGEPSVAHPVPLPGLDVVIGAGFGVAADDDSKQQGRNYEPGNKYVAPSTLLAIDAASGGRYRVAARSPGEPGGTVLANAARDAAQKKLRLFGFFGTAQGNLPFRTANGDFDPGQGNAELSGDPESDRLRAKYGSHVHYSEADVAENPTLADMTRAALEVLGRRERFWLMVEAGDVDWASHANNIDTAIGAVQSGDAAVRAVFDWVEKRDAWKETAVIVTSDHGHLFVLTQPEALAGKTPGE